ncbi:MAG: hypothetical protein F6K31_31000 [Symploca sp. SIO2G7]|nr:hypothetical protein [Symploca sp. SIO2G7]
MPMLSGSQFRHIVNDLFGPRKEKPAGTSSNETVTEIAMVLIGQLSPETVIANSSYNNKSLSEAQVSLKNQALLPEQIQSIRRKLTESAGELQHFDHQHTKSIYFASDSEDVQLITGVRIACKFINRDEPVDLTVIFDEKNKICCLDFSEINNSFIFPEEENNGNNHAEDEYFENLAKHIIYELALKRYDRVRHFHPFLRRPHLKFEDLKHALKGCVFSSIKWGQVISTSISKGRRVVKLPASFERENREPFNGRFTLIFNHKHMLISIEID